MLTYESVGDDVNMPSTYTARRETARNLRLSPSYRFSADQEHSRKFLSYEPISAMEAGGKRKKKKKKFDDSPPPSPFRANVNSFRGVPKPE